MPGATGDSYSSGRTALNWYAAIRIRLGRLIPARRVTNPAYIWELVLSRDLLGTIKPAQNPAFYILTSNRPTYAYCLPPFATASPAAQAPALPTEISQ